MIWQQIILAHGLLFFLNSIKNLKAFTILYIDFELTIDKVRWTYSL